MAVKGNEAKNYVIEKIKEAFGSDYLGEADKKIYVLGQEGGQKIQIAIALTCPKVEVNFGNAPVTTTTYATNSNGDWDFSDAAASVKPTVEPITEITQDERDRLAQLMAQLGL